MATVTFLGTGDSMGVPRSYCSCSVCEEARTSDVNRRLRSSVLIEFNEEESGVRHVESSADEPIDFKEDKMLLDCGPDFGAQMEARGLRWVEHVLLTHPHNDHVAGLPEYADACRWLGHIGRVYAPADVNAACKARYPWVDKFIEFTDLDPAAGFTFAGWAIRPWRVCHGKNGYAYAYRFERGRRVWVYCSDAINLSEQEKAPMLGADLLVLGTSFYREPYDFATRSVYDMIEGEAVVAEVGAAAAVFTHMSHDVDMRREYPLPGHIRLAQAGLQVEV
ncbi:hypothetical protein SY83_17710 [Paenibacillus swuensis]|uniref:Metallo-beta-lactamase domain-containing protein n=1 Tax=Paenibacillus swuensis TaxID=1178515 RepID=A0A172TLB6_9BACL|nr:MBL fold metallo-hydrolase [Paenibacillus swuensis]ANE47820.1 hypothetical protein SY83_17710 [Paenibacillus swuensis]